MRCTYQLPKGEACRAQARRGLSRCRWHSFTLLQSQLRAIRPSAADTLEECPYRFLHEYVLRAVHEPSGPAAAFGTIFHSVAAEALRMHRLGLAHPETAMTTAIGRQSLGVLSPEDREALCQVARWWQPPCSPGQIVFVEPCARSGAEAEPDAEWLPLRLPDGTEVWGTPDLVCVDDDGGVVIGDWKTGRQSEDPCRWAPVIYAALAEQNWPETAPAPFTWPVRVVWYFVREGLFRGRREALLHREDVLRALPALSGMLETARGWWAGGHSWPATPENTEGGCRFCSLRRACPGRPPHDRGLSTREMVRRYSLATARIHALEQQAKRFRDELVAGVAAGEEVLDPETGEPVFAVKELHGYRGGEIGPEQLRRLRKVARDQGFDFMEAVRVTPTGDPAADAILAREGLLKSSSRLDIRRARSGEAGRQGGR